MVGIQQLESVLFDRPRENCGIVAVYSNSNDDIVPLTIEALRGIQNRGQEGWGIITNNMSEPYKARGLVPEYKELVEEEESASKEPNPNHNFILPKGNRAIAHTMYTTSSTSSLENFQPLKIDSSGVSFFIAHNGTVEVDILRNSLKTKPQLIEGCAKDSRLMGIRLAQLYSENKDWFKTFKQVADDLKGSYSVVILDSDQIIAARGGRICRPLCIGYHVLSDSYIIASESSALNFIGAKLERDIRPGDAVTINENGVRTFHFFYDKHFLCPFEFTYFSKATSNEDGRPIQNFREETGQQIAVLYESEIHHIIEKVKNEFGDDWNNRILVTWVPDSARPISAGFSKQTGLRLVETMLKNRYRGFIEPNVSRRAFIINEIEPFREVIDGNYLLNIDDSIVRGDSSKIIVRRLEEAGALGQSWFISFPPIISPCYAGIDFANAEELLAYQLCKKYNIPFNDVKSINEAVAAHLGVDFVGYNTFESLSKLIRHPICPSCTSGEYKSILGYDPRSRNFEELRRF